MASVVYRGNQQRGGPEANPHRTISHSLATWERFIRLVKTQCDFTHSGQQRNFSPDDSSDCNKRTLNSAELCSIWEGEELSDKLVGLAGTWLQS